jgi:TonB family protein
MSSLGWAIASDDLLAFAVQVLRAKGSTMAAPRLLIAFLIASLPVAVSASGSHASSRVPATPLAPRAVVIHRSHYASVPRSTAATSCAATELPQALATPEPLLHADKASFTVSFLIGPDGRVHSALILESSNSTENPAVLHALTAWRYRPASCNGVPMEAEGRIEFLSH